MARKIVLFLATLVFSVVPINGCAPELTVTNPDESWGGSGGMSSSSGEGGSESSSSSSSSSSGSMGSENCLDGVDNDDDGNADCADSDCNIDYECTDAAPNGWLVALVEQGNGTPPPGASCKDGQAPESFYTGMAGPAECSECMCGGLSGVQCNPPKLTCYPGSQLCFFGAEDWTAPFGPVGSCVKPTQLLGNATVLTCHINASATVSDPGTCAASVVDFPNKDPWTGWVQACTMKQTGTGCGAGQVCARRPTVESLCIGQSGQQVCPAGWSKQTDAHESAIDTRACTPCTCTPNATCTGGSYRFFDMDQCADGGTNAPIDVTNANCKTLSPLLDGNSWSVRYETAPVVGGSCTKSGGTPTGSITPTGPMTFCCK